MYSRLNVYNKQKANNQMKNRMYNAGLILCIQIELETTALFF